MKVEQSCRRFPGTDGGDDIAACRPGQARRQPFARRRSVERLVVGIGQDGKVDPVILQRGRLAVGQVPAGDIEKRRGERDGKAAGDVAGGAGAAAGDALISIDLAIRLDRGADTAHRHDGALAGQGSNDAAGAAAADDQAVIGKRPHGAVDRHARGAEERRQLVFGRHAPAGRPGAGEDRRADGPPDLLVQRPVAVKGKRISHRPTMPRIVRTIEQKIAWPQ